MYKVSYMSKLLKRILCGQVNKIFTINYWQIVLSSRRDVTPVTRHIFAPSLYLTRFNKIATQGAPQMAVDKEDNSLSRVYSYYSKFNLRLFYV